MVDDALAVGTCSLCCATLCASRSASSSSSPDILAVCGFTGDCIRTEMVGVAGAIEATGTGVCAVFKFAMDGRFDSGDGDEYNVEKVGESDHCDS